MTNFDEAPQRFEFEPEQRHIPGDVRRRIKFGGVWNQVAWLVLGVGSILFWVFAVQSDVTSWYYFQGPLAEAQGKVLSSARTSYSSGKSRRNNGPSPNRIYAHRYEFVDSSGLKRDGVSYARGAKDLSGQQVTIEYPADDPSHSRIQNMRPAPLDAPAAITAIVPLVGLVLLMRGFANTRKSLRLLAIGEVATAELAYSTPTSWKVNNQRVHALNFTFHAADGSEHKKCIRTHEPHLYQGVCRTLLYNPANPNDAEFLQRMPGRPLINSLGEIELPSTGRSLLVLILPTVVTLGNVTYVMMLA